MLQQPGLPTMHMVRRIGLSAPKGPGSHPSGASFRTLPGQPSLTISQVQTNWSWDPQTTSRPIPGTNQESGKKKTP